MAFDTIEDSRHCGAVPDITDHFFDGSQQTVSKVIAQAMKFGDYTVMKLEIDGMPYVVTCKSSINHKKEMRVASVTVPDGAIKRMMTAATGFWEAYTRIYTAQEVGNQNVAVFSANGAPLAKTEILQILQSYRNQRQGVNANFDGVCSFQASIQKKSRSPKVSTTLGANAVQQQQRVLNGIFGGKKALKAEAIALMCSRSPQRCLAA